MERELRGARRVYLSPDGELAFVSFAALPGIAGAQRGTRGSEPAASRYLVEDYEIAYLASGRDLLRQGAGSDAQAVLVGAPDFGEAAAGRERVAWGNGENANGALLASARLPATRPGLADLRAFLQTQFTPLPGTEAELAAIRQDLIRHGQEPVVLSGAAATEAAVKAVKRPSVLHLASHGFFLAEGASAKTPAEQAVSEEGGLRGLRGVGGVRPIAGGEVDAAGTPDPQAAELLRRWWTQNPMHRSGIALAGANDTIAGRRPAGGDDGILTAEEVAGMDLWGTRLVAISACESGLGEVRGGEGVFGLRRAFTLAGAQNLVMSLWPVSDRATQRLMSLMYRGIGQGQSPARALLSAQRQFIDEERAAGRDAHPFFWAAFVASGNGTGLGEGE